MTQQRIDAAWTVNQILHRQPNAVSVLDSFGIDSCCGGALSLEEAARRHGADPRVVLEAIEAATPRTTKAMTPPTECACRFTPGGI
jgi:regulator of cell morphogenesis and NO signaling